MNDQEFSRLMKDVPSISDNLRDEHITNALNNFSAPSRTRSSRTALWSIAAAALLVVGAGIGVSLQSLTDDDPVMYADGDIESLGAVSTDINDDVPKGSGNDTKGIAPIGPCDAQYAESEFVAVVRIGTERVAVYAIPASSEPVVQLVDPSTCDEFAITRR